MRQFAILVLALILSACASSEVKQEPTPENKSARYEPLRGRRFVIYIASPKAERTEAAIQIENRVKSVLTDKGLVIVDFDQHSLANILRNDGSVADGQAKRVASNADLIISGRLAQDDLKDTNVNNAGTFRARLRLSMAITETNSAIERGRFEEEHQEMANSYESAATHAAKAVGDQVGAKVVEKLLYIYR